MPQTFKSIYYPDFPGDSAGKRSLTLAFGAKDKVLFEQIRALSSHEIRELIGVGTWNDLRHAAEVEGLTTNGVCLRKLRSACRAAEGRDGQALLPGFAPSQVLFDPIQSTYRGGADEPLHEWYPYLEAYSPQFVQRVIEEFAPDARSILDPFAGLGREQWGHSQLFIVNVPFVVFREPRMRRRRWHRSNPTRVTASSTIRRSLSPLAPSLRSPNSEP